MKEWEKELQLYRLAPAPPKENDLQKYILYYLSEKDDKYIAWFLHYYEHTVNAQGNGSCSGLCDVRAFLGYQAGVYNGHAESFAGLRSQPWRSFYRVQGICSYERGTRIYPYHADGLYRSEQ